MSVVQFTSSLFASVTIHFFSIYTVVHSLQLSLFFKVNSCQSGARTITEIQVINHGMFSILEVCFFCHAISHRILKNHVGVNFFYIFHIMTFLSSLNIFVYIKQITYCRDYIIIRSGKILRSTNKSMFCFLYYWLSHKKAFSFTKFILILTSTRYSRDCNIRNLSGETYARSGNALCFASGYHPSRKCYSCISFCRNQL